MDGTARILIVDDELFFREAISEILTSEGFGCVTAELGEEALDRITDPSLGVVVLDIRMPDIDGIEVLGRIREIRPSLRVIMLSASTDQDLVLEALRLGACDYLAKPLHEEELVLAVRRALDTYNVTSGWTRLRSRLERLVARMEAVAQKVAPMTGSERRDALYEDAVRVASEVLEAEKTSLMLWTENVDALEVVAALGHRTPLAELESVSPGQGVAGIVLQRKEAVLVEDVGSDPLFAGHTIEDRYASSSFVVAPLLERDEPLGVVCVTERSGGNPFSEEDISLLRLLAMQFTELLMARPTGDDTLTASGLYVDAARAAQVAEELPKDETEVVELDRDAELARWVCQAVSDEIEPSRILKAALDPLVGLLPAAPVAIYLLDAEKGLLVREGESDGSVGSDRAQLDPGAGLTGLVVRGGHMVVTSEPELDPRYDADNDTPESGLPRPMMCLPLILRGKVVGVFRAFLQDGDRASARTGEVLGAALSSTLRSILLYRSLIESVEEVAEARRAARR